MTTVTPKTWQGNSDNWTNGNDWSPTGQPGSGDNVVVATGDPQVTTNVGTIASLTDSANINLTDATTNGVTTYGTLAVSGATTIASSSALNLNNDSTFTTGSLTDNGGLSISGGVGNGSGGDSVTVNGLLTNTGYINMGGATFDQRTAGDLLTTQGLSSSGSISLSGPGLGHVLTEINVTQQAAGFGTAGVLTGSVSLANDSVIQFAGGGITQIGNGGLGGLTLDGPMASIQDAGGGINSALTGISEVENSLALGDGATLTLTGNLENDGSIGLDTFSTSVGGTSLTIAGTLTNTSDGNVTIDAKNGNDTITAQGLTQQNKSANAGNITLYGSAPGAATADLATLDVTGQPAGFGTAGVLTGGVYLNGDALIQFDGGTITAIGNGGYPGSALFLDGSLASISNGGGQNSALAIANITANSYLDLADGATLTTGALTNAGGIGLDNYSTDYGTGGSTLTVNGTLTNTGSISVEYSGKGGDTLTTQGLSNSVNASISLSGGNSVLAELNVTNQAVGFGTAGVVTGGVYLYGNSLLQFAGGSLTTIATQSTLTLDGTQASISNGGGQNSALTRLATINGTFNLQDGASLALTGNLANAGDTSLNNFHESTADTLSIAGRLTNTGSITLSPDQASTTLQTRLILNSGTIDIDGSGDTGSPEALVNVTGQAAGLSTAGALAGHVNIYGANGPAVLQFASGSFTTIATNSELTLNGAMASVQDANGAQNSALASLVRNYGGLYVENGASLSTTGNFTNTGTLSVDDINVATALTVNGTVTNSGTVQIYTDQAAGTINVSAIRNIAGPPRGSIIVDGSYNNSTDQPVEALLNVASAAGFGASGVLSGYVDVDNDGVIQFASGGIRSIAANSELLLDGGLASIQDAGGPQNGALTTLATNAGTLALEDGVALNINRSFTNTGTINLSGGYTTIGSTTVNNSLDITGSLTNSGTVQIYAENNNTATVDALTIKNLVGAQTGSLDIEGDNNSSTGQTYEALLNVTGGANFGTSATLTGNVYLNGQYGAAVIQFASGTIRTIAANSSLHMSGPLASIQDANGKQNSALTGLSSIAGTLTLDDGATLATGTAAPGAANTLTVGSAMTDSGRINAGTIDVVSRGSLTLANGQANAAVTVESGGTFAGIGSTDGGSVTVASGGTFNAGFGATPGAINTGALSMASGSTFGIELGGTPQSGNFSEDNVQGTVSLSGATLSASIVNGYTPSVGDSFEIIANDGSDPVSGTFAGLAQGAVTAIGGNDFQISYTGGDGNDVTLTDVGPAGSSSSAAMSSDAHTNSLGAALFDAASPGGSSASAYHASPSSVTQAMSMMAPSSSAALAPSTPEMHLAAAHA